MFNIEQLNKKLALAEPDEIIRWVIEVFHPHIAMTSSFQSQSLPLLHIVSEIAPKLPVIFLDTGFHFAETLLFRDRLVREWGLVLKTVRATLSRNEFVHQYGNDLYSRDPDLCCYINKVEPMQEATQDLQAWISGIRRDQSPEREQTQIIEETPQGILRIHPMANWTRRDIWQYIDKHHLPEHPLFFSGYLSIGCAPCTRPMYAEGDDQRNGRWPDQHKKECGLHTLLRAKPGGK